MKNKYFIYLLLVLLLIVGCTDKNNLIENNNTANILPNYETIFSGDTNEGAVLVGLTPTEITDNRLIVQIGVNTHSVDLSQFDLKEMAVLEYDGKTIKPIEVPSLSGHHSSGNIVFETNKKANEFKVTILDIPNIEERVFEWN